MEPFRFKKLGAIPYTRTGEELVAAAAPGTAPATYEDPAFFTTPILMQGQSPECGGYSLSFALAYLLTLNEKLSGSFSYAYEKTVDGVPTEAGTLIPAIGKAAQNIGSCLDTLFPDDGNATTDPEGNPTPYREATQQAIQDALTRAGWIPLMLTDLSWSGLQAAIAKYKTVIVEAQVGEEWFTAPDGTTSWTVAAVLPIRPPKEVIDAHFFALGGRYDQTNIWFANSWSAGWGESGFGYFQENYIPFVKNALVLYKAPPSVLAVVNHPTLTQPEKLSIIQNIINDIEQAVGLIHQEAGQL
ncbi:MAG TPA: hypothetical protein VGL53_21575 [Bryobacteraceae bacterium]